MRASALLVGVLFWGFGCGGQSEPSQGPLDVGRSDTDVSTGDSVVSPESPVPWKLDLSGWKIAPNSDAMVQGPGQGLGLGELISSVGFDDSKWVTATVPGTVMGALMDSGALGDLFFGDNLFHTPGFTLNFLPKPPGGPYSQSWWWRTEFELPMESRQGRGAALLFDGINYRANIWVNGKLLAQSDSVVGAFREHRIHFDEVAVWQGKNAVAVEVFGPEPLSDLAIHWVDWNPEPPDRNMGLWMPASVEVAGGVTLSHPAVRTRLLEGGDARLSLQALLSNQTSEALDYELTAEWEGGRCERKGRLRKGSSEELIIEEAECAALLVKSPKLWWPHDFGIPHLYPMKLSVTVAGEPSDVEEFRFGIREVTSEVVEGHTRVYRINGKPILIRGGGWTADMFYRDNSSREDWELRYVKEMGLNTIRLEGKFMSHRFYDKCDEMGLLLMPGWCCCDMWESWDKWKQEHHTVARASLADQLRKLRRHASVFTWYNGSDFHPPQEVEKMYLEVIEELGWHLPVVSNATETGSDVSGPSGVKMTGPYNWVPPNYWYEAVPEDPEALVGSIDWSWAYGGAFSFNTESSPGPSVPPVESLLRMMDAEDVWPLSDTFLFHSGNSPGKRMQIYMDGLDARLGPPVSLEDFAFKSQIMAYEAHRAMFEAQARNKYSSTGFIQWMMNDAWPSTIWHLYDYYLRPGGAYFGVKAAGRPLHAQLAYDDLGVYLINHTLTRYSNIDVNISVYSVLSELLHSEKRSVAVVEADAVVKVALLPELLGKKLPREGTYFVNLVLKGNAPDGEELSDVNFYWMPAQQDIYDYAKVAEALPVVELATMTDLALMGDVSVSAEIVGSEATGGQQSYSVRLSNPGKEIAFFVEVLLTDADGAPLLPIFWDDNYVSLLPGEIRTLRVEVPAEIGGEEPPQLLVRCWNCP